VDGGDGFFSSGAVMGRCCWNPCLWQWAGTAVVIVAHGNHGIEGEGVSAVEITGIRTPQRDGWEVIPSLVGRTCAEGWKRCNRAAADGQVGRGETRLATLEAVVAEMM
jgi:hypothetical protein